MHLDLIFCAESPNARLIAPPQCANKFTANHEDLAGLRVAIVIGRFFYLTFRLFRYNDRLESLSFRHIVGSHYSVHTIWKIRFRKAVERSL